MPDFVKWDSTERNKIENLRTYYCVPLQNRWNKAKHFWHKLGVWTWSSCLLVVSSGAASVRTKTFHDDMLTVFNVRICQLMMCLNPDESDCHDQMPEASHAATPFSHFQNPTQRNSLRDFWPALSVNHFCLPLSHKRYTVRRRRAHLHCSSLDNFCSDDI